jgi:Fe-S-cluster containining protein
LTFCLAKAKNQKNINTFKGEKMKTNNELTLTAQMLQIFNSYSQEQKNDFLKNIFFLREQITKAGSLAASFQYLKNIFNNECSESDTSKAQCREGCSYCCSCEVLCFIEEAKEILKYCKKNNIEIDWQEVERQKKFTSKEWSGTCVFLKNNRCQIYSVRPIFCQKHLVASDPSQCNLSSEKMVDAIINEKNERLISVMLNVYENGSIPIMLLRAKEEEEKIDKNTTIS